MGKVENGCFNKNMANNTMSKCLSLASFCAEPPQPPAEVYVERKKANFAASPMEFSEGDRLAVVAVHFGTTHADTRERCMVAINDLIKKSYPGARFAEAYTSRIIIHRLKQRGVEVATPSEVFAQLHREGYTHLLVQSTHIIEGVEMESLRREVDAMRSQFKQIRLGRPLLYSPEDFSATIEALAHHIPHASYDAVVLVGHGTYTPITASYAMMDYMIKVQGYAHWCVSTIENYPSMDEVLSFLNARAAQRVLLVPFMFVAGEHAKEDIAGDWREQLEDAGYHVDVMMEGMGENPRIQRIFMRHMNFAAHCRELDIMSKKHHYSLGE